MESDKSKLLNDTKLELIKSIRHISDFESIIREALKNKGGDLWVELQRTLFYINNKLMTKGYSLGVSGASEEWQIRNIIEKVEQELLVRYIAPVELTDAEEFVSWLKLKIAGHRVNRHPLFIYFDNDDISTEEMRYFLSNYRVNMQRFHLHVAAYSLIVPFEMREELYENLHDEFGEGDFKKAHPNLFEPLMDFFGGALEEDWNPETYNLLNTKINLCWFADGLAYGLGGMGALELSIPAQQRRILANLRRRGLSEKLVEFFVVHCELDESHGDGWFAAGIPYLKSAEDFDNAYSGAIRMLEARAGVYDGILAGIESNRKELKEITASIGAVDSELRTAN
ncbi:MAG: iron-containing redox enzyme family protein [Pseudomonadales bacterium]|nr:iron-containing redox enzyme family protein [Pseudomonadales bacterium]